jgi:hypothetical protein
MNKHDRPARSWISVNEAIDRLDEIEGQPVEIYGILCFDFEDYTLWHFPKAERRTIEKERTTFNGSSIWIEFMRGSLQPNTPVLDRWHGHRVAIFGFLNGPYMDNSYIQGRGHMGGCIAEIVPYSIERM